MEDRKNNFGKVSLSWEDIARASLDLMYTRLMRKQQQQQQQQQQLEMCIF